MCILFHKWSKWSKPTQKEFSQTLTNRYTGEVRDMGNAFMWVQDRVCEKCNKYERRIINNG